MAGNMRNTHELIVKNVYLDTNQELVAYMTRDCYACRSEGFRSLTRLQVSYQGRDIIATLNITDGSLLKEGEIGLSLSALKKLGVLDGSLVTVSHCQPLDSITHLRSKIFGDPLGQPAFDAIIGDIAAEKYANVEIASFVTACAGGHLSTEEACYLTKAMINSGNTINWGKEVVADKHCVGGLPGNRTTMIVVPIIASLGITIPKTSSRAITSPAGTADAMEALANVDLTVNQMRQVVEKEYGCIALGTAIKLSPADEIIIRVERALNIDSTGQMVASILSKKAAAGATHCIIDIPLGKTAKVRSMASAVLLEKLILKVAAYIGINARATFSDGSQPVGFGIGPSLEARDVLAVLQGQPGAPPALRKKSLLIAAEIIQMVQAATPEDALLMATQILESGKAFNKLVTICEAQGGMRVLKTAPYTKVVEALQEGILTGIDNRKLATVAKLAGAPGSHEAGIDIHVQLMQGVTRGQPLFTIHANSAGELAYACEYFEANRMQLLSFNF